MRREWLQVEHTLRFFGQGSTKNIEMEYTINNLKSAVIALMGFKLGWDDNIIFYKNMKHQTYKCIDNLKENWLETESIQLEELKDFINNNL